jgi:ribonuclease P protein component
VVVHAASARHGIRVGLAVNRAVGGAVVRNRVKRRLREAVRALLPELERRSGCDIVVRATPRAADASFAELSADLASTLAAVSPASSSRLPASVASAGQPVVR